VKRKKLLTMALVILPMLSLLPVLSEAATDSGAARINTASEKTMSVKKSSVAVKYDNKTDFLAVSANGASLQRVLNQIAKYSGIEVIFIDEADLDVNVDFDIQSDTLEQGLKDVLKGQNYLLRYKAGTVPRLLIGVMILPVGEDGNQRDHNNRGKRTVRLDDEAYYRAKNQMTLKQVEEINRTRERWDARLSELPPETKDKMKKHVESRLKEKVLRDQRAAEWKEKRDKRAAARKARMTEMREKGLQEMSAEDRAALNKSREQAKQEMRVILFDK